MKADVIIIGAGLAGSISAFTLAKAGYSIALVDARREYPPEFRAEKMGETQMAQLARLGLADIVRANVTRHDRIQIARFERVSEHGTDTEYSYRYADLVNGVRRALPSSVHSIVGRAEDIVTSDERQGVTLADGRTIEGRILIVATGLGDTIRRKVGIERTVLSRAHSLAFGFSLATRPQDCAFDTLICYGKGWRDRIAYLALFRIGAEMRANLFVYRTLQDAWTKQFRAAPAATLMQAMPKLEPLCGRLEVAGDVAARSIDLSSAIDYRRDGVVLIGDAFRTCCPIIGLGIAKVLTDVEQLCGHHLPGWFETQGMGAGKISAFYDDETKQKTDTLAHARSLYARSLAIDPGLAWSARRLRNTSVRRCLLGVKQIRQSLQASPFLPRAGTASPETTTI